MYRFSTLFAITAFFILLVGTACASPEGGEHGASWNNVLWRIVNITLFAGALIYLIGKKVVAFLKNRTETIAGEIAALEERKADAAKRLEDIGRRIALLETERRDILAEYEAQGQALKAAIVEQAEKAAARIMAQAKTSAQNEIDAAMADMRARMADKIIEATERLLAAKLTPAEHAKLIDNYLAKVVIH